MLGPPVSGTGCESDPRQSKVRLVSRATLRNSALVFNAALKRASPVSPVSLSLIFFIMIYSEIYAGNFSTVQPLIDCHLIRQQTAPSLLLFGNRLMRVVYRANGQGSFSKLCCNYGRQVMLTCLSADVQCTDLDHVTVTSCSLKAILSHSVIHLLANNFTGSFLLQWCVLTESVREGGG